MVFSPSHFMLLCWRGEKERAAEVPAPVIALVEKKRGGKKGDRKKKKRKGKRSPPPF